MSGDFDLTRRGFLQSSMIAPLAGRLLAAPAEMPHMRLAFVAEDGGPDRVEFQFAASGDFTDPETLRLIAPVLPGDPDQTARIVAPERLKLPPPALGTPRKDDGWYAPTANERITLVLNTRAGPGGQVSEQRAPLIELTIMQVRLDAVPTWVARLDTRFWRKSLGGNSQFLGMAAGDDTGAPPTLLGVLRRQEGFVNSLGPGYVSATASVICGLPVTAVANSRVGCRLLQVPDEPGFDTAPGDVMFAGDWSVQPGGTKGLRVVRDETRCPVMEFPLPRVTAEGAVATFLRLSLSRPLTFSTPRGTALDIVPPEDAAPRDAEVTMRIEGGAPIFSCAVTAATGARVSLAHRDFALGSMVVPAAETGIDGLRYFSRQPGRKAVLRLSLPLLSGGKGIARLQAYSFGIIGLRAEGSQMVAGLDRDRIDAFRITGQIAELGVALDEEMDADAQVTSRLTWEPGVDTARVALRLMGVPDGVEVSETAPPEDEEGRTVPVHRSAILIDWRVGQSWDRTAPFADAPLDLALEGASLATHRDTDMLSLVFRFFNFRLLTGPQGTKLRMRTASPLVEDLVFGFRPDRPILTMEVPGGHVLKESHRLQFIRASDLPQPDNERLMNAGPTSGATGMLTGTTAQLYEALRRCPIADRVKLREEIRARIIESLDGKAKIRFRDFADAFRAEAGSRRPRPRLPWIKGGARSALMPPDQAIYIGPDMMDRDHWDVARTVARMWFAGDDYTLATQVMMNRLRKAETPALRELARKGAGENPSLARLTDMHMDLTRNHRLAGFPEFAAFHEYYRTKRDPVLPEVFPGMDWIETDPPADDPDEDLFNGRRVALLGNKKKGEPGLLHRYFVEEQKLPQVSRSRMGAPSRFCYFWDTRDKPDEDTPFSLNALLNRDNADMSVPLRSRRLFEVDEDGVRRPVHDFAQTLAQQGIEPRAPNASASTSISRMGDVYRSARRGIAPWETRLQFISRLDFSVPEDALLDQRQVTPPEIYSDPPDPDRPGTRPNLPSWSISLAADMPRQGLRAVASPDFNPLHYLKFVNGKVKDKTDPTLSQAQLDRAYDTPDRSSVAPWSAGRATEVEGGIVWTEPEEPEDFQTALSRYHRHSLVATSIPGLPTIGDIEELDENGEPIEVEELPEDTGSLPAPPGYLLDDLTNFLANVPEGKNIRIKQSIMLQQDFQFAQATLSPFGPSTNINAPFLNKFPGRNTADVVLYDAQAVSQFDHDSTYGEDEETLILETGYLFPLGHKAALLQHTKTAVMHPDSVEGRDYPVAKEVTRITVRVSEPLKTQWYGQAVDGRERPFDRCQILTVETPDLVLKFDKLDPPPLGVPSPVTPDGRINLGTDGPGIVFWPRIAEVLAGTFRFQVLFDDGPAAVEMPLIYVGFGAANDPEALKRLCEYYMGLNTEANGAFLREVDHAGARRRYANELRDTDTTYETESWVFGAEGRPTSGLSTGTGSTSATPGSEVVSERAKVFGNNHTEFRYDALLAATGQPPFYPFMQSGIVRVDRIARQTGQRRGPLLKVAYDIAYLQRKRAEDTPGAVQRDAPILPPPDQADIVLGTHAATKLEVGARGASVGAIGRPAGHLAALARREGPLLHKTPPKETTDRFAVVPTDLAGMFGGGGDGTGGGDGSEGNDTLASQEAAQKAPGSLSELICDMLGDPDMKILGIFGICEIIDQVIGTLADNMPVFEEIQDYGESLLGDGLDLIQTEIVGPLRDLLGEIERRLATAIAGKIAPARLLPELTRDIKALNGALAELEKARVDDGVLVKATNVAAAGKSVLRSLDNLAKDPVSPLRTGLEDFLENEIGIDPRDLKKAAEDPSAIVAGLETLVLARLRAEILDEDGDGLNGKLRINGLTILTSSTLRQSFGADFEDALNGFITESIEAAAVTVFNDASGSNIDNFKDLVAQLDPSGAGKAKWDDYAEARIASLKALLESAGDAVKDGPGRILLDLIGQYDALRATLDRLAERPGELQAEFEGILDELSDEAEAAARALLEAAQDRVEAQQKIVEAQLAEVARDLVKQIFALDIEVAKDLFAKGDTVVKELGKGGDIDVRTTLQHLGDLVRAVDDAYFAGTYTAALTAKVSSATDSVVAPVHKSLCLVIDYVNAAGSWISAKADETIPTAEEITDLFKDIRDPTIPASLGTLEGIIPQPVIQGDTSPPEDAADLIPSADLPAEFLKVLDDLLAEIGNLAEMAANESLADIDKLLKALKADLNAGYDATLDALESYVLALAAALRVRDGKKLECPSQADLLLRFTRGDFLDAELVQVEAQLTSWANIVTETEALSKTLVDQLARIRATFGSDTHKELRVALQEAKADHGDLVENIETALKTAEVALCDRLVRAITPLALTILRSVDRVLNTVADKVLRAKAEALTALRKTLATVRSEIKQAALTVPALGPVEKMALAALDDLGGTLGTPGTAPVEPALGDLIQILVAYSKSEHPTGTQKNPALDLAVKEIESLPEKLAASLLGPKPEGTPQTFAATENAATELQMAGAHATQSMLALAQSLRFDKQDVENKLAEVAKGIQGRVEEAIWTRINEPLTDILKPLKELTYDVLVSARQTALKKLEPGNDTAEIAIFAGEFLLGIKDLREILVAVDNRGLTRAQVSQAKLAVLAIHDQKGGKFPGLETEDSVKPELLKLEADLLDVLLSDEDPAVPQDGAPAPQDNKQLDAFKRLVEIFSGKSHRPAPQQILETIEYEIERVISGEVTIKIDLADLRDEIEKTLLGLVPSTITNKMTHEFKLKPFGGIFLPREAKEFKLKATTTVDLLDLGSVKIDTQAEMTAFDIALFGKPFDVFTMSFSGAKFTLKSGEEPDYDITFVSYKIGEKAKFIEELAGKMGAGGSGPYIQPAVGFPGIEAGYRMNLPAITLGAATFLNVGIVAGAVLPFDNREALFTVGISSRQDPFIILIGVWGGGGHFALYTNGREMVGFDVSFVFAGGGAIAAGPLNLEGRVSVGIFLRKIGDLSETSGDFFAGGSGNIWIFGFSASLRVRVGQDGGGNMVGSAVFSFSFSLGLAKIRFSITLAKREDKGLKNAGGEQTAWLDDAGQVRWASAGTRGPLHDQLILAAADGGDAQVRGDAKIVIAVPRFEDDFGEWRKNFADQRKVLNGCLEAIENA